MQLRLESNGHEIDFAQLIRGFDKISKENGRLREIEGLTELLIYEMGLVRLIKLFLPETRETIKEVIEC